MNLHVSTFILGIFTVLAFASCKQETVVMPGDAVIDWVTETVDSIVTEREIGVLQLGITRVGAEPIFKSFGSTKIEDGIPHNEHSVFPLSNTSKLFTGIIINSLIDEGVLNLEDTAGAYLQDVITEGKLVGLEHVNIQSLLFHRSGMKDNEDVVSSGNYSEADFINELKLNQIGDDSYGYRYSDLGYILLAMIAQEASARSFRQLFDECITVKFGLENTSLTYENSDVFTRAADGLSSSVSDLVKLQAAHIESYLEYIDRGRTNPLIQTERTSSTGINYLRYGHGMMQITSADKKYLGYYRSSRGHSSVYLFSLYPDVGLVLLTDKGGPWVGELCRDLMDGLVDEDRIKNPIRRSLAWTFFSVIDSEGVQAAIKWFEKNKQSKKYRLSESEMNSVGYRLLRRGLTEASIQVFSLNVKEFPESSNVYDSLGEAYLESGNDELARVNYQKSLDLDPFNSRAKRALRRLDRDD